MAQLPLPYLQGQRPGSKIYTSGGFYYHCNQLKPNRQFVYLRCVRWRGNHRACPGRAAVRVGGFHVRVTQIHNHGPDPLYADDLVLRAAIMARVRGGDPTPFSQIVREEGVSGNFSAAVRARVTAVKLRSSLRRARLIHLPPIPRNLGVLGALLSLPEYSFISRTMDESDNLYAGMCGRLADGTLSVVFISRRMQEFMKTVRKVYSDGTFKSKCQEPQCIQIFSIVCSWRYHVIPLVRALMQRRTANAYVVLLTFLKGMIPDFYPLFVMCDHEKAEVKGWLAVYPRARVMGCLYHYAVAIFNMVDELGLRDLLAVNVDVSSIVRSMAAIPLVPSSFVKRAFIELAWEAVVVGVFRELKPLFEYFYREWIPRSWTISVSGSSDRTNNCSESANRSLNKEVRQTHPNVWHLIRGFARVEDQSHIDIATLASGNEASRARKLSAISNDARVTRLTTDLCRGDITLLTFLHGASRTMEGVFKAILEDET